MNDKTENLFRSTGNWQIKFTLSIDLNSDVSWKQLFCSMSSQCTAEYTFEKAFQLPGHRPVVRRTAPARLARLAANHIQVALPLPHLHTWQAWRRTKLGGPGPAAHQLLAHCVICTGEWSKPQGRQRQPSCVMWTGVYKTHAYLCDLWDLTDSPGTKFSSLRSNFTGSSRFTGWQSKSQAKCQSQQHLFQTKKKILQENSNKQRFKQAHLAP